MQALTELREIAADDDAARRVRDLEGWIQRWVVGRCIDCDVEEPFDSVRARWDALLRDVQATERLVWRGPSPCAKPGEVVYRLGLALLAAKPLE